MSIKNSYRSRNWIITLIALTVALLISFTYFYSDEQYIENLDSDSYREETIKEVFTGFLTEGTSKDFQLTVNSPADKIAIALEWEDEPDMNFHTNEPDTFTISVNVGQFYYEETHQNPSGTAGKITISEIVKLPILGVINATVTLDDAGDQIGPRGINGSPFNVEDNSNSFTLTLLCMPPMKPTDV